MISRVLVLGADGFIGRAIAKALVSNGHEVVGLVRRGVDAPEPGVAYRVVSDPGEEDFHRLIGSCGVVFHAASSSTPGSSAWQPIFELQQNLAPTLALLEALQKHPSCRLVYISSGGTLYGDMSREHSATERDLVCAKSYYAAGKAAAEQFIRAWSSQSSGTACIIRPSNVYGPGQSERQGFGIIPKALGSVLRNETLTIWGDGSSIRDYLYISDLTALCTSLVDAPLRTGTTLMNVSSGEDVNLRDLLAKIETIAGIVLAKRHEPAREVDVSRVSIDSSLARSVCGWRAEVSLTDGLERTWSWFRSSQR